jgi:hypothetical protein
MEQHRTRVSGLPMTGRLLLCAALASLLSMPAGADALRCGTRLISEGDSRAQVEARCGAPADIIRRTRFAAPIIWRHGRPYRVGDSAIEVIVEEWTYNLGPQRFMRRVRFEDGVVVAVDTLGYGYRDSDPPDRAAR